MNIHELWYYLNQLRAMGVDEATLEIHKQQWLHTMPEVEQRQASLLDIQTQWPDGGDNETESFAASYEDELGDEHEGTDGQINRWGIPAAMQWNHSDIPRQDRLVLSDPGAHHLALQWAIACDVEHSFMHGVPINTLLCQQTWRQAREQLALLWDIDSYDELVQTVDYLLTVWGYEQRVTNLVELYVSGPISKLKQDLRALNFEDMGDNRLVEAKIQRLRNLRDAKDVFADAGLFVGRDMPSLAGVDYATAIGIVRMGIDAHYLTTEEGMPIILEMAREIQKCYRSWEEFGVVSYFAGYVWYGASVEDFWTKLLNEMRSNPDSPWLKLPWDMPLG